MISLLLVNLCSGYALRNYWRISLIQFLFCVCSFGYDIASALSYIQSQGIVHLDLKPANIIVSEIDDRCKLADFGCSVRFDTKKTSTYCPYTDDELLPRSLMAVSQNVEAQSLSAMDAGSGGTTVYRAPELFQTDDIAAIDLSILAKADVYSFGVTLWQLTSRMIPFADYPGVSSCAVIYAVVEYGARPDGSRSDGQSWSKQFDHSPVDANETDFKALYSACWQTYVDERPTADELVRRFASMQRAIL